MFSICVICVSYCAVANFGWFFCVFSFRNSIGVSDSQIEDFNPHQIPLDFNEQLEHFPIHCTFETSWFQPYDHFTYSLGVVTPCLEQCCFSFSLFRLQIQIASLVLVLITSKKGSIGIFNFCLINYLWAHGRFITTRYTMLEKDEKQN